MERTKIVMRTAYQSIILILGKKCNLNCSLCTQQNDRAQVGEALEFTKEAEKYIKDTSLFIMRTRHQLMKVSFWGGEPLLYPDRIEEVAEKLRGYPVSFSLTTNGVGLAQKEIVDLCNKYKILVGLSNDGRHTAKVKNFNSLENHRLVEGFLNLVHPGKRIMTVIHALSQNYLVDVVDYVSEKLDRKDNVFIRRSSVIRPHVGTPVELLDFDIPLFRQNWEEVVALSNEYCEIGAEKANYRQRAAYGVMAWYNAQMTLAILRKPECSSCGHFFDNLPMDLQGNVYPCHNWGESFGNIKDDHEEVMTKYLGNYHLTPFRFKACRLCSVQSMCRGYCPAVADTPEKDKVCEALRQVYYNPDIMQTCKVLYDEVECRKASKYVSDLEHIYPYDK